MKRIFLLFLLTIILLFSTSCSSAIVKVEIGSFPSNIVYYVGESDTLNLDGGTVLVYTSSRLFRPRYDESSEMNEYPMSLKTGPFNVVNDIDFSIPGIYEVHIIWLENVVGRFPIQVIER